MCGCVGSVPSPEVLVSGRDAGLYRPARGAVRPSGRASSADVPDARHPLFRIIRTERRLGVAPMDSTVVVALVAAAASLAVALVTYLLGRRSELDRERQAAARALNAQYLIHFVSSLSRSPFASTNSPAGSKPTATSAP